MKFANLKGMKIDIMINDITLIIGANQIHLQLHPISLEHYLNRIILEELNMESIT